MRKERASVKRIVREMVKDGIDGYACMIDLPGTVGGGDIWSCWCVKA